MPRLIDKMVRDVIEMIANGLALDAVLLSLEREYASRHLKHSLFFFNLLAKKDFI